MKEYLKYRSRIATTMLLLSEYVICIINNHSFIESEKLELANVNENKIRSRIFLKTLKTR